MVTGSDWLVGITSGAATLFLVLYHEYLIQDPHLNTIAADVK